MTDFAGRLLAWFDTHGRKDLPWQVDDAYRIWVSEIMLQQTQVQTVIPYYERFMRRFPDLVALADAEIDAVLEHWSGLGYYARARNLHKAAQLIRDDFDGRFPETFEAACALPGIGRSTAAAILALAFDQRHAILDGNVKRVLARHRAISGWPGKSRVAKQLWAAAEESTPADRIADYTQAIMDLGATVCRRSRPLCETCPVNDDCRARKEGTIAEYPGRKSRPEKPLRETTMVLAVRDGALYLERRPPAGIWGGLWSLPELDHGDVDQWCRARLDALASQRQSWSTLRHSFSHYELDIHPVVVHIDASSSKVAEDGDAKWHSLDAAPPGGIAAPVRKLIESLRSEIHVQNN
jgi:A/G-specific adenine glycosylase